MYRACIEEIIDNIEITEVRDEYEKRRLYQLGRVLYGSCQAVGQSFERSEYTGGMTCFHGSGKGKMI